MAATYIWELVCSVDGRLNGETYPALTSESITTPTNECPINSGHSLDVPIRLFYVSGTDVRPTSQLDINEGYLRIPQGSSLPGSGSEGDMFWSTTTHRLYIYSESASAWQQAFTSPIAFSRGGTLTNVLAAVNTIVWRSTIDCTVTALKGYRVGGSGATVNAGKGTTAAPTSPILATPLSLTSAETWMDGGTVQNTAFTAGDPLIIQVLSASDSPPQIAIQVDFIRTASST